MSNLITLELQEKCQGIWSLLSDSTKKKITSLDLMGSSFLHGAFGSNGFFIYVNKRDSDKEYAEIIKLHESFSLKECQEFNQIMLKYGYLPDKFVPEQLTGQCLKPNDSKKKCKASPDKWSCIGCGKSWVPKSYMSKTCKSHPFPEWAEHLDSKIDKDISEAGGVSNTAPLVWAGGETKKLFSPKK